jgi:heterotetrameric sarcosine oxidase gamma subunit
MSLGRDPRAAVRRSALAAVHQRLARGGDAANRWPMSYGDPDGERRAVAGAIGLAEPGLYDKLIVKGRGALAAVRAAGLEGRPGRVTPAAPGGVNVWAIADDEVLLVAAVNTPGGPAIQAVDVAALAGPIRAAGLAATDVSSGWTVLRLVGPRVRDLLEELVAEDLSPDAVPDQGIVQVPMAGCRVILSRRDLGDIPGCVLLVARDEAEYIWGALTEIGAAHGIRPVGGTALVVGPAAPVAASATGATR